MIDLARTYDVMSRPLTRDQLAAHHRAADELGRRTQTHAPGEPPRPVSLLAAAVPFAANLDVAVHALHVLPPTAAGVDVQLSDRIREDAAIAIHLCERALELDGATHLYQPVEWRPTVYEIATGITTAACIDREPPSIVSCARDCVGWLALAIADLDHDDPDGAAAISETLGRLLALWLFAEATGPRATVHGET